MTTVLSDQSCLISTALIVNAIKRSSKLTTFPKELHIFDSFEMQNGSHYFNTQRVKFTYPPKKKRKEELKEGYNGVET